MFVSVEEGEVNKLALPVDPAEETHTDSDPTAPALAHRGQGCTTRWGSAGRVEMERGEGGEKEEKEIVVGGGRKKDHRRWRGNDATAQFLTLFDVACARLLNFVIAAIKYRRIPNLDMNQKCLHRSRFSPSCPDKDQMQSQISFSKLYHLQ